MDYGENPEIIIDWGDGSVEEITSSNIKHSEYGGPDYTEHEYNKTNAETKITITGKCDEIYMSWKANPNNNSSSKKLVEIEKWGNTGSSYYDFGGCSNLRKIASPEVNTFRNVTSFDSTFWRCSSLTSIPEGLFDNCPAATSFVQTFGNCSNLTSIPEGLFDNCQNVMDFSSTFEGCSSLTGPAIPLWERVPNGKENDYQGEPDGIGCYAGCERLTNYEEIPDYWKESVPGAE